MSLSDLASLGSFVSAVAVLISLIYLALQVRQAEINQRAALSQGVVNRAVENNRWFIDSGMIELMARARSGETDFTRAELSKLSTNLRMVILNAQDNILAHRAGLIDPMISDTAIIQVRLILAQPALRALWFSSVQPHFTADFRQEIERMIAETPLAKPAGDPVERFQAALAKVME